MSNRIIAAIDALSRYKLVSGGTGLSAAASLPAMMLAASKDASHSTSSNPSKGEHS